MKIKNNQSHQSNERKTLKLSQNQPKIIEKENKPANKNIHINIVEKKNLKRKIPTPPAIISKENILKRKPDHKNVLSTKKMIDLNFKKQKNAENKSLKALEERKKIDNKINKSTILNHSKEQILHKNNIQSEINHKENVSYVPAYHSTRDIRKVIR